MNPSPITLLKVKRSFLYLVMGVLVIGSLLLCVALHFLWRDLRMVNEPLHSTTVALGVLAAIVMVILLLERKQEEYGGKLFLLAMGFLGMGLLDGFHAVSSPEHGFTLLHSVAGLVGGFWFALVWLPRCGSDRHSIWKNWITWGVAASSILFGTWTLLANGTLPLMVMVRDGEFTVTAVAINLLAGMFFLAAALRLLLDFYHSDKIEIYLLACMAMLLGLTGLMFKYSSIWSSSWWVWHLLRLIAFLLVLKFVFYEHQQRVSDLRLALAERKRVEEEREQLIIQLQDSLSKVKTLSGFLPICASCKKIRDDKGYWTQIEAYIRDRSEAEFSHGLCPDCSKKLYGDLSETVIDDE